MPSAFAYDADLSATLVRQGDLLTYATFDGGDEQKKVVNPPNMRGGDWYVWCVYDDEDDVAIVVAAIRTDHLDGIKERMGKIDRAARLIADVEASRIARSDRCAQSTSRSATA